MTATCPDHLTPTIERMIVTLEDPPWVSTAGVWGGLERETASHAQVLSEWRRRCVGMAKCIALISFLRSYGYGPPLKLSPRLNSIGRGRACDKERGGE